MGRPRTGSWKLINGTWHVRNTVAPGVRRTFDMGTSSLTEAKRLNRQILAKIEKGENIDDLAEAATSPGTFAEYAKTVNDRRKARGIVSAPDEWQRLRDHAFPIVGGMTLRDVRPRHIRDVLEAAVAVGAAPQTIRHLRAAMYKVLRSAVVDELVEENVVAKVDPPAGVRVKKVRVQLTDDEFSRLIDHLTETIEAEDADAKTAAVPTWMRNARTRAAYDKWRPHIEACAASGMDHVAYAKQHRLRSDVLLGYIRRAQNYSSREQARVFGRRTPAGELRMLAIGARTIGGQRTSDLIRADWLNFDLPAFTRGIVVSSKTKKPRPLIIPEEVRPLLIDWWRRSGSTTHGPVFPVLRGPRLGQRRRERGVSFAARLRAACRAAGLTRPGLYEETDYTLPADFHSFRRAFVTALRRAGVPADVAMKLSGHSSREIHEIYVGDDPAFQAMPANAIPRLPTLSLTTQVVPLTLPGASGSADACGETSSSQSESSRATQDSNLRPSAPEADGVNPPEPPSTRSDLGSQGQRGSRELTAAHGGSGFRLFLPQGSDGSFAPPPRVPPHRSERAGQRLEEGLRVAMGPGPVRVREERVLELLAAACADLGLTTTSRSGAAGGGR